ncbi:neuraminidase-like domain-containing protein [Pseudomonas sp. Q11]|uniref:Tc toxin subunit A-related protein n=1 Tax=Pseudomonas sp. Q11 TaxID=2968470 RepID=UPI00210A6A3D|nr:neuraminidase-like domain-containing protein [Pseudomonas sp. Q11]MCQ6258319.1 neuraminidase-like domain-containing protein [Pseudomonas sp. Q11]
MTEAIKKQLDESLRDALLALYLNNVAPASAKSLRNAHDLYEYWLLDVLVSQDVPTTPVACAIASLQQYINRILMNLEPGYDPEDFSAEHRQTWRNELHQYATWAAYQKLLNFPSTYLDPTLRANKSDNFLQLENALNQNRIQPDAVQSAVLAYLSRFEEVANLTILNGYIDGEDFANSTYYFIAKSRTENTYFWRSLDMAQRPLDSTLPPPSKQDQPDPYAWSDWEKADVPIPDSAVEHSIRPVWFNNRLFVVWAECIHQDQSASSAPSNADAVAPGVNHPLLRLSYCFKKQDGMWSTPRVGLQGYCEDKTLASLSLEAIRSLIGSVAVRHRNGSLDSLCLILCAKSPKANAEAMPTNAFSFIKTVRVDKNLVHEPDSSAFIKQTEKEKVTGPNRSPVDDDLIEVHDQRIQTKLSFMNIEGSDTPLPKNIINTLPSLDDQLNGVIVRSADSTHYLSFNADNASLPPTSKIRLYSGNFTLNLMPPDENLPSSAYIPLGENSTLRFAYPSNFDTEYKLSIDSLSNVILDDENSTGFTLPGNTYVSGKLISVAAVRYLNRGADIRMTLDTPDRSTNFQARVLCEEELLYKKYVVFRQPDAMAPDSLTYENLKPVATSSLVKQLPALYQYPLRIEELSGEGDTLFYGVALARPHEPDKTVAFVLKAIKLNLAPALSQPPGINSLSTPNLGATQFIDFAHSSIKYSDGKNQKRQPIRLNTLFAAELIRRTENSLDELFDWATQHLPEPTLPGDPNNRMDFHGAYGRYFTELFLYLPWLVAHRLNAEHRYEEAERWLRYVFDPGRRKAECWRSVPLLDGDTPSYADQAPHDPHQIALSHPVHFRKALYFLYLDILANRGDAAYRGLTPDSLSEAKLWYVRTLDLLGPRPVVQPVDHWTAVSLHGLSTTNNDDLRHFEKRLPLPTVSPPSLVQEGRSQAALTAIDNPYLRVPFNPQLLKCWDVAESRLYNLRHNLDIAGKPLHLPVFAAPLDPRALDSASAPNTPAGATVHLPAVQIPHYRFTVMHSQAQSAVESIIQFGATLLSLIERKEQVQLQELQQQQAWDLAKISVGLQRQALNVDRQNRQALLASKAIVQGRVDHYQQLLEKGISEAETQASELYLNSGNCERAASITQVMAGSLMLAPNILGFSTGGMRWEGVTHAASALAQGAAIADRTAASNLDRTAQFNRRQEEWTQARDQSQLELAHIDAQLAQFAEQETATRLQLRLAESTLGQAKANYDFLSKRFTKAQLYQWLNSQFAALYRQAYDATLALCLAAEACWQYEIADFNTRFIQPGAWHATYRGLGAGELLKMNLLKMHAQYLRRHERELEIRKTVSLRELKRQTPTSTLNKAWPHIHADLKKGTCEFELPQSLFEDDYKDQQHYLRRIKTISVSLPALIGPYENIRATLTQTASKVFLSPGDRGQTLESLRANQQIALSTGVDDNGLFTLNFNDDRYLPFEHTGAISKWQLTFPNPEAQKDLLDSLTDVIVHVSYTARVGGGAQ